VAGNAVQGLAATNAVELEAHTASPPTLKDETTSEVPTLEAPTIKFPEQNEVIPEIQLPDNQMGMPDFRDSPPGSDRNSRAEAIETPANTPLPIPLLLWDTRLQFDQPQHQARAHQTSTTSGIISSLMAFVSSR